MSEQKRQNGFGSIWQILIFLVSMALIIFAAIPVIEMAGSGAYSENDCPSERPSFVELVIHFKLPPQYTNLESLCSPQSDYLHASFDIPPRHLNYVYANLWTVLNRESRDLQVDTGDPQYIDFPAEFAMAQVESYSYYCFGCDDGAPLTQELFVDMTDSENYRVYVMYYAER